VRRSSVVALALALVASALVLASTSASAEPYTGTETGVLSARPSTFETNQQIELLANFPSSEASKVVTFLKETSPGSGDYTPFGTDDAANDLGNAYFKPVTVDAEQKVFARTSDGKVTQVLTLKPTPAGVIAPTGPDTGNLTQNPTTYEVGTTISMTANFPDGTFPITLYKEGPADTWTAVATKTSNSSGNATFTGFPVTSADQRVFARRSNNNRTEIDTITPKRVATLSIRRDCTGNTCGTTATAYGELNPLQEGRVFTLQRLSGSSWVSVSGASPATTGADGKAQITFSLAGVPQWTTRTYRLTSAASGSSPSVTSRTIVFMPGPTELGENVLRVDVDKGIYPTTKGPEYTGKATLSVGGTVVHDHVPLESFGVRGNSSAEFDKKPYKLKFLNKPPKVNSSDNSVFGMLRAKSWTLLASYRDRSLVREKVSLDLGIRANHIEWTPQSRYVEMFVNDQYRGSYLMTESVKIDGDRIDVDEEQGMVMEVDGSTVADPALGFKSSKGIVFAFKDPDEVKNGGADPTGVTPAKRDLIRNRINAFEAKLYNAATRTEYTDFIDVDSAIDFMLVKEFTKDHDADFYRSHYFSWDPSDPAGTSLRDGKFHFGPAWDFDGSAGMITPDSATHVYLRSPEGWMMRGTGVAHSYNTTNKTHWFVQLLKDPPFEAAVKARWSSIRGEFEKVHKTEVAAAKAALGAGATNDRNRWNTTASQSAYDQEIAYLTNWYEDRFTWMDGQLN
jgi:hypothetical protein